MNKQDYGAKITIYCEGCGKPIATITRLITPTDFKERYGETCRHCGRSLSANMKLRQGAKTITILDDYQGDKTK